MKFKIDQNLPAECGDILAAAGHDAMTVWQQSLGGAPDERIVQVCRAEDRVLITADLDLSDIVRYPPAVSPGFIVFRSRDQSRRAFVKMTRRLIPLFGQHGITGRLWILDEQRLRIRGGAAV